MKALTTIGSLLVKATGYVLLGGFLFALLDALAAVLPRMLHAAFRLPLWGLWIVFLILGGVAVELYKKLPNPKD